MHLGNSGPPHWSVPKCLPNRVKIHGKTGSHPSLTEIGGCSISFISSQLTCCLSYQPGRIEKESGYLSPFYKLKFTLRRNKVESQVLAGRSTSPSSASARRSFENSGREVHRGFDRATDSIDSLISTRLNADLHTDPSQSTTTKNIHVTMHSPATKNKYGSMRAKDFNEATLTDDGIMITSQGLHLSSRGWSATEDDVLHETQNNSTTSIQSESSFFETASLISCVTCLSDNYSTEQHSRLNVGNRGEVLSDGETNNIDSENAHYSSVTGQMLVNTVIPYGRILHAKYLGSPKGYSDNAGDVTTTPVDVSHSSSNLNVGEDRAESPADNTSIVDPFLNGEETNNGIEKKMKTKKCQKRGSEPTLVEITFAKPRRHDIVPKHLTLSISYPNSSPNVDIVEEILRRSFKGARRERKILVIINPFGGKGKAKKMFVSKCKPILLASKCSIDTAYTKYAMHAVDIAREVDIDKYDTIACASGDGIPYEVINGLFQRPDRAEAFNKLAVTQLPCGSGNAMSVSCHWTNNPSYAALCLVKSVESRIDLMCCSQPSYYKDFPRLSFLSQTYGIIAESDINTEFIRWMGPARFELGVAFNVLQRKKYPCELYVKYAAKLKNDLKVHYLEHKNRASLRFETELESIEDRHDQDSSLHEIGTDSVTEKDFKLKFPLDDGIPSDWERVDPDLTDNLGIFYTGKMPYIAADTKFFPAALPADGTMDLVITDARTPVTRMAPILLALDKGSHVLQPEVVHSKILAYKLVPKITNSLFSVDGEKFPLEPLQVEVMPRLCKTLLRNGSYVDTEFDSM